MLDQRYHGLRGLQFDITPISPLGANIKLVHIACSGLHVQGGCGVNLDTFEQQWLTRLLA